MEENKIENNQSYQKLNNDLKGAESLHTVVKIFSFFGLKNKKLNETFDQLTDMREKLDLISKSPDKFNSHFSKRGWIAHESMNFDFMLTSIELAEKNQIEIAEIELIDYYTSEKMKWLVSGLRGIDEFNIRYNFFLLAYEDTIQSRFHSAVPLLLMMIDGVVNDIDKGKGFFAENTNLTAWDSISAHSSGLTVLKEILNEARQKTNIDVIIFPYRNGILHGRDLGFANQTVTAKCWSTLFAIKDWAVAVKQGKKNPPKPEPKITLPQSLSQLKKSIVNYNDGQKRNKLVHKKVEEWKPRTLVIGKDILSKSSSEEYEEFTPEQEAIRFAEYWTKNNFGKIANQIHHFSKVNKDRNSEAGKIRKILATKKLLDYKLENINDCSPAISEITINCKIEFNAKEYEKKFKLRFIYGNEMGEILIIGDKNGQWKFLDFLTQIEYLN